LLNNIRTPVAPLILFGCGLVRKLALNGRPDRSVLSLASKNLKNQVLAGFIPWKMIVDDDLNTKEAAWIFSVELNDQRSVQP